MRYNIGLNLVKTKEHDLNLQQAVLMAFCYDVPSWADSVYFNNAPAYFLSKGKIIDELSILTDKHDTIYRLMKQLEEKGLVKYFPIGNRSYLQLTDLGKKWNEKMEEGRKFITREVGNEPVLGSDKNPIYNTISNNTTILGEEATPEKHQFSFTKKKDFIHRLLSLKTKFPDKYPKAMIFDFAEYWLEMDSKNFKLKYEKQQFFEIPKRLSSWFKKSTDEKIDKLWDQEEQIDLFKLLETL